MGRLPVRERSDEQNNPRDPCGRGYPGEGRTAVVVTFVAAAAAASAGDMARGAATSAELSSSAADAVAAASTAKPPPGTVAGIGSAVGTGRCSICGAEPSAISRSTLACASATLQMNGHVSAYSCGRDYP